MNDFISMNEGTTLEQLQYPIGRFKRKQEILTHKERNDYIQVLRSLPELLSKAVEGFTEEQLDTPYRPEGWTVRQLIHHIGDSHLNAFARFKFAIAEDKPAIVPYNEKAWAQTPEVFSVPVHTTLKLIEALHERWVALLEGIKPEDFSRAYIHPDSGQTSVDQALALYAWHSRHHLAQLINLIEKNNW